MKNSLNEAGQVGSTIFERIFFFFFNRQKVEMIGIDPRKISLESEQFCEFKGKLDFFFFLPET